MKRISSSDSLGALMSICPNSAEGMDEEGCVEEYSGNVSSEKKRRLSHHQVKALEKSFEVENKLEPERKVKLAGELGLQPRQVAVWFQNRRARWKTKQLERDYGLLKANNDALKHKYEKLRQDNESLLNEIKELKSKLSSDDKTGTKFSVKEEKLVVSDNEEKDKLETECDDDEADAAMHVNLESFNRDENEIVGPSIFGDLKDWSSDSDSSAILNDYSPHQFSLDIHSGSSASYMNMTSLQFSDNSNKGIHASTVVGEGQKMCQTVQFVKIEEHNFFGEENECSNLFSDDQAPTLHWYSSDDWN